MKIYLVLVGFLLFASCFFVPYDTPHDGVTRTPPVPPTSTPVPVGLKKDPSSEPQPEDGELMDPSLQLLPSPEEEEIHPSDISRELMLADTKTR